MDAIERLPTDAWTAGIDQHGDPVANTFVAELTRLLDLGSWQEKIPGYGLSCATNRCTPLP